MILGVFPNLYDSMILIGVFMLESKIDDWPEMTLSTHTGSAAFMIRGCCL